MCVCAYMGVCLHVCAILAQSGSRKRTISREGRMLGQEERKTRAEEKKRGRRDIHGGHECVCVGVCVSVLHLLLHQVILNRSLTYETHGACTYVF